MTNAKIAEVEKMSNNEIFTNKELQELAEIFGCSDADVLESVTVYD